MIHNLDPIAFEWGGIVLSWYWLAYFMGFMWVTLLGIKLTKHSELEPKKFITFMQWGFLAMILSSRLFYVFFYHPQFFWQNPLMIPKFWLGGMSFHGALIGPAILAWLMSKRCRYSFYHFTDLVFIGLPVALLLGRIANFINGELYGRVSNLPWSMVFPLAQDGLARHPSQLYQACTEGFILGIFLWSQRKRLKNPGEITLLFVGFYGLLRFFVEFTREPDRQLGTFLGLSFGQYLCLGMIALALVLWRKQRCANQSFDTLLQ
jgi:phosphatidylglycerol---prolipoprotein diacylglyceryl transferase